MSYISLDVKACDVIIVKFSHVWNIGGHVNYVCNAILGILCNVESNM